MNCPACGAELPADALFCIECGVAVTRPATTGATTALPRFGAFAVPCPACGADSPEGADYCVRCGRRLTPEPARPAPPPPASGPVLSGPVLAAPPYPGRRQRRRGGRGAAGRAGGAVFLVGLGLLMLLKAPIWPTILIVIGLSSFARAAVRGRAAAGLGAVLWLFGLAVLFSIPRLLVPGLIAIAGISVLLHLGGRRARWP
jgi:hypothetical protein